MHNVYAQMVLRCGRDCPGCGRQCSSLYAIFVTKGRAHDLSNNVASFGATRIGLTRVTLVCLQQGL
jgi:hypothetical protein